MTTPLRVLRFEGIHTDTLGHYFGGLGLLASVSSKWADVRGCWRGDRFALVHPTLTVDEVMSFLLESWEPVKYERWWDKDQKSDTKAQDSEQLRRARNTRSVCEVELLEAHIVGAGRNQFNPVFGAGGTVGRRDLPKVHACGLELLALSRSGQSTGAKVPSYFAAYCKQFLKLVPEERTRQMRVWLEAVTGGDDKIELPPLRSAGTWFLFCNEFANNGQSWTRDDTRLSPWAFLLAVEGALFLVGDVNRRLSMRARPYAVFPFVCDPAQPTVSGEVGMSKGEFWAPLWDQPITITECRQLLKRGLARIGNRSAQAPHEFAVAAMAAGTDSGVSAFVRFDLRKTTSAKVYEAVPQEHISVSQAGQDRDRLAASSLLMSVMSWLNRLPFEPRDQKQKGKFRGLRGPIEQAIIRVGESVEDAERWRRLLLLLEDTQNRIDKNKAWREKLPALPQLSPEWFLRAWPESDRPEELDLACSIASVGAGTAHPLLVNVFGVAIDRGSVTFTKGERSPRVVWNEGHPVRVLVQLVSRRLVDAEKLALKPSGGLDPDYFVGPLPTSMRSILRFLTGELDFDLLARWIPALSLIDWSRQATLADRYAAPSLTGEAALYALFRPIFQPHLNSVLDWLPSEPEVSGKPAIARRVTALLQAGDLDSAIAAATNFYRSMGRSVVEVSFPTSSDPDLCERLAASMLIPVSDFDIRDSVNRWLIPLKRTTN